MIGPESGNDQHTPHQAPNYLRANGVCHWRALAAAVSRAGGLGIVGSGYAGTVGGELGLETELAQARSGIT